MKKCIFLILIAFVACKKSHPAPTPPTITKPVLLATETIKYPGTPDTLVNNYTFAYNANNKLTGFQIFGLNTPFTYNAQGLLISYGSVAAGQVLLECQYDQNNNLISSTFNSYDQESQLDGSAYYTYTIANGLVSQINQYTAVNGNLVSTYNLTYDNNKNLIKREKLNNDGSVYGTDTFTFGTHHSPNYSDHIKFNLSLFLDDDYFNENEKLTQTSVINNYQTTDFTFTYTYQGQYPLSKTIMANGVNNYYYYTYLNLNN